MLYGIVATVDDVEIELRCIIDDDDDDVVEERS